jgi:hypothetical protein
VIELSEDAAISAVSAARMTLVTCCDSAVHGKVPMKKVLALILAAAGLPGFASAARAQNLEEIFRKASPTVVVVRSKGRDVGAGGITDFKYGAPGEVIGIVSQNISKSGGSEGLGFIVSINSAKKLLVEGKVFWGALQGTLLTGDLAAIFNVPAPAGFLVKTVAQDSMAWKMGLQGGNKVVTIGGKEIAVGGDIILSVDDIPVVSEDNIEQIRNKLAGVPRGTPFKMSVLRAGKVLVLTGMTQGASR